MSPEMKRQYAICLAQGEIWNARRCLADPLSTDREKQQARERITHYRTLLAEQYRKS